MASLGSKKKGRGERRFRVSCSPERQYKKKGDDWYYGTEGSRRFSKIDKSNKTGITLLEKGVDPITACRLEEIKKPAKKKAKKGKKKSRRK